MSRNSYWKDAVWSMPLEVVPLKPFIVFRNVLPDRVRTRLVKRYAAKTQRLVAGKTEIATGMEYAHPVDVRQAPVEVDGNEDLYGSICEMLAKANSHYRIVLTGIYEPFRFCQYGTGAFSGMHSDYGCNDRSKLTFTMKLSDDYTGGSLRILGEKTPTLNVGDAVVFPAWQAHEVLPCKSGVRQVLVGWASGPQLT